MKITWLTASSAFLRNSAIFSSVWRLISLIIVVSWWVGMPSDPRCCNIEIARFVFSTIPLMHDSMVWMLRHSSSPLVVPEPLPFAWLVAPPLTRFPRDELSDLSSRSSRLLLCCWRRKYIYGPKIKILFSTDLEISFAPSLHRRWSVEDNWGNTGRKKKQLLKSLPRVVLWAFLILISNYHTFAPRRQKNFYFLVAVYWPFVPDVNGFHFGIQTEMDDLLNAVGLTMKASMNDVVVLQVKCNHSIRVTNYCLSGATRTVI